MFNPDTNRAARIYLINSLIKKFNIDVRVDVEFCRKAKCDGETRLYGVAGVPSSLEIVVKNQEDLNTLAHELIHCFQFWTGRYRFNMPQLRRFMEFHELEFDETFNEWFLPFWRASDYPREDFTLEYVAYYVSNASNGWQLFQLLARKELG